MMRMFELMGVLLMRDLLRRSLKKSMVSSSSKTMVLRYFLQLMAW